MRNEEYDFENFPKEFSEFNSLYNFLILTNIWAKLTIAFEGSFIFGKMYYYVWWPHNLSSFAWSRYGFYCHFEAAAKRDRKEASKQPRFLQ